MRGAAMSLTAASGGFVVLLLTVSVVQGQDDWGVTYTSTEICAFKGSTVDIHWTYTYPPRIKGHDTTVERTFWFTKEQNNEPVDLRTDSDYTGRVQYHCGENSCTLTITDLRESDSAEYKFRFITNQPGGRFTGSPGVTVFVSDLQVRRSSEQVELRCHSSCNVAYHPSYVWYQNGQKMEEETFSLRVSVNDHNRYSCAVKGHEDYCSPPVLVQGQDDWGVTYTSTEICAFKGSTVDIHCTYTYPPRIKGHDTTVKETYWFTKGRNDAPVDLKTDSDYTGRVQYHCGENSCTLTITDLRESDSAQYKFRFITNQHGGRFTGSPGVTVSVSDLQVRRSSEQVELRCHSSCNVADHPSYVWYQNGQKMEEETFSLRVSVNDHNRYSCAVKGHEDYCSPPVYPPKLPSVSVSPSGQIVEGSSVNLTCSSDANPAANYTWYKENEHLHLLSENIQHVFSSIQSSDSGDYFCTAENELGKKKSENIFVDVKYPPRLLSVSVSPSGQIVEGSSVNLTCSTDANPAANYTWYKENEDSPKASGQIFTITDFRAEHSGNYCCEAQNERGRHNSTLYLTVGTSSPLLGNSAVMTNIIRLTLVVLMLIPLLLLILWTRRKKTPLSSTTEPNDYEETVEMDSPPVYENVSDLKAVTAAQTPRAAGRC